MLTDGLDMECLDCMEDVTVCPATFACEESTDLLSVSLTLVLMVSEETFCGGFFRTGDSETTCREADNGEGELFIEDVEGE